MKRWTVLCGIELNNDDEAVIRIYCSKMKVNEEKIRSIFNSEKSKIMIRGGKTEIINPTIPFS